jgi:hypothetical protein
MKYLHIVRLRDPVPPETSVKGRHLEHTNHNTHKRELSTGCTRWFIVCIAWPLTSPVVNYDLWNDGCLLGNAPVAVCVVSLFYWSERRMKCGTRQNQLCYIPKDQASQPHFKPKVTYYMVLCLFWSYYSTMGRDMIGYLYLQRILTSRYCHIDFWKSSHFLGTSRLPTPSKTRIGFKTWITDLIYMYRAMWVICPF